MRKGHVSASNQSLAGSSPILWTFVTIVCGLMPVAAVHAYAIIASVYLGHWPTYNNPDPAGLSLGMLDDLVAGSWLVWIPFTAMFGVATARIIHDRHLQIWPLVKGIPLLLATISAASGWWLAPVLGPGWLLAIAALSQVIGAVIWERQREIDDRRRSAGLSILFLAIISCIAIFYWDPFQAMNWYFD